ncbi:MAG: isochorismatase family protein, partial [Syntrophales bacterium LBB04]|nr:isochorismatase family protein [Syntrophales bacterium LBB04]
MLSRNSAVLIVIDIQGNLFQVMQDKDNLLMNAIKVIRGATIFNIPIIVTEQVPEKLGQTLSAIARELNDFQPVGKENFSC